MKQKIKENPKKERPTAIISEKILEAIIVNAGWEKEDKSDFQCG